MPRFILLDHSLKGVGGHHFDYALHVLRAAESLGYEPVLVSNKRFWGNAKLPKACRVLPLFRYHTYSKYTIFAGQRKEKPSGPRSLWQRASDWLYDLRHKNGPARRIRDFSGACRKAFVKLGFQAGDVVFVPTLSELDLAGLATFLESEPATREIDWHLQFHFNIFDGREPDYSRQEERLVRLRQHFEETLARVPRHRLHFYNTSDILTRQYNRLEVARFEELPYPINEAIHARRLLPTMSDQQGGGRHAERACYFERPLRITCAGGVRAEKGQQGLGNLVRDLWTGCLDEGRAQLLVQAKPARFTGKPKFQVPLPDPSRGAPQRTYLPTEDCADPVVYIRHPLGIDEYEELIRRADIGLLLYDSVRYYSRRAGVLGELLASGIPVVVPSACWLAEQIAEANFRHVEQALAELPAVGRLAVSDLHWHCDDERDDRSRERKSLQVFGKSPISAICTVPQNATELAIVPRWAQPSEHGTYLRIEFDQFDENGEPLERSSLVVGRREPNLPVPVLIRLIDGAASVRLALTNAYDNGTITLRQLELRFVDSRENYANGCPLGAVGLIAAEADEAPRLLREMIRHYAHYRETAEAFSAEWSRRHDPRLTVQTLLDKSHVVAERRRAA
jgi:hypothetical protein